MDASLLSALSALGGAIISGLTSLLASLFATKPGARAGLDCYRRNARRLGIAIFFIPVTFYVVERFSSRKRTGTQAPQPEALPQPQATPAALATPS